MYKIFKADKDAYITNKVIRGSRMTGSNVGAAGSLDLFKLYGITFSGSAPNLIPNTELSRLLVHFDIDALKSMVESSKIDINSESFWCKIRLKDVYGGQPTPSNFTVSVFPLSASFDEGLGKDISYYSDYDKCSWSSSSYLSIWQTPGCSAACFSTGSGDYITASLNVPNTEAKQFFKKGDEDLEIDVTKIVSATLSGEIPDSGFRISFENSLEDDSQTYFVKRFASRHAYDESKHPRLIVGFDDSITDDSQNLTFDETCRLVLYNYSAGSLVNIKSGSSLTPVVGNDSVILKLVTEISGGFYSLYFTGSQHSLGDGGICFISGTYRADVNLPSNDSTLKSKLLVSSSIVFTPVWTSLDGTVAYVSGSNVSAYPQTRTSSAPLKNFVVGVTNVKDTYVLSEEPLVRVNIFDNSSPLIKVVKVPVTLKGIVLKQVHYQVRDVTTNEAEIPFDTVKNSTKVSSDSDGMFFKLNVDSLTPGKTYVVDILIEYGGTSVRYPNASAPFRVESKEDQT